MPEERQHTSSDRLCSIVEQKRCCHSVGACFRPYTVLASISLSIFGQDLNYSISHECVKKSSAYATGKTWPCSRRQKQYSECHQCRCACKQSVSIHVFLKATACSTSAFDIACGFQRLTHLQSSAESMSSCELCFKIFHAVQFISSCIPSMTSSSENSESAWKSWGSLSLIPVCFSSMSSFTASKHWMTAWLFPDATVLGSNCPAFLLLPVGWGERWNNHRRVRERMYAASWPSQEFATGQDEFRE